MLADPVIVMITGTLLTSSSGETFSSSFSNELSGEEISEEISEENE